MHKQIEALATRYSAAVTNGRFEEVEALCTPDFTAWQNFSRQSQTIAQNIRMLRWVTQKLADFRYEQVDRQFFEGGFVQQHILCGQIAGTQIAAPACMIVQVRNGKIARVREYIDSAALGPLSGSAT